MMPRSLRSFLATIVASAAVTLLVATTAHAGCPSVPDDAFAFINGGSDSCPKDPSVRWTAAIATFDCSFFAQNDLSINCSGNDATCVSLCRAATDIWNTDLPGRFRFAEASDPVSFCDTEDGIISVGGTTELCDGSNYGNNVLAVTLSIFFSSGPQAGQLIDANITVNQRFNFTQKSFQATLAHEFGHSLGLSHPDQCGDDFNVLMRSAESFSSDDPCFVLDPTQADINGAFRVYPVTGPTPTPSPSPAACGDADGSGTITVTDGVNVLRAAAELSSTCTAGRCDVDGNGSITVTDGVNVLRAAAGLSFTANCP